MYTAGFEPTIPAGDRTQTHALNRAAAGFKLFNFKIHIELSHN